MTVARLGGLGYGWVSKHLKTLILLTCGVSLFCGLFDNVFTRLLGMLGPQSLLSLSWYGVDHFYFWQPVSYLFVHHGAGGLSIHFLLELFFNMYILWMMGSAVASHVGDWPFLRMYFFAGVGAALVAIALMATTGIHPIIVGAGPAIFGVITAWALLFPEQDLMLPFGIVAQGKWIAVTFIGVSALIDISQFAWIHLAMTLTGVLLGYLYAVIAWETHSPFEWTRPVDRMLSDWGYRWRHRNDKQHIVHTIYQKAKVFDLRTGEALFEDEEFMDAMLAKISATGEDSLTRKERARMERISQSRAMKT